MPESIRQLNLAGYLVLVVTNQRGVARGMMTMDDVRDIHQFMLEELEKLGARVDGIYVCPHNEGECSCRKPEIGLFLMAEKDFLIDRERSWMVGDSGTDVEAGERYGVRSLLTDNLRGAVKTILEMEAKGSICPKGAKRPKSLQNPKASEGCPAMACRTVLAKDKYAGRKAGK